MLGRSLLPRVLGEQYPDHQQDDSDVNAYANRDLPSGREVLAFHFRDVIIRNLCRAARGVSDGKRRFVGSGDDALEARSITSREFDSRVRAGDEAQQVVADFGGVFGLLVRSRT